MVGANDESATDADEESDDGEDPNDALERLRVRYADGELADAEFERRLEILLETETVADVERYLANGEQDSTVERGNIEGTTANSSGRLDEIDGRRPQNSAVPTHAITSAKPIAAPAWRASIFATNVQETSRATVMAVTRQGNRTPAR